MILYYSYWAATKATCTLYFSFFHIWAFCLLEWTWESLCWRHVSLPIKALSSSIHVLLDSLHNIVMTVQNHFLTMVFLRFDTLPTHLIFIFCITRTWDWRKPVELCNTADSALPLTTPTDSVHTYFYSLKSNPEENYLKEKHSLVNRYRTGLDTNQKHQHNKRHQYKRSITQHKRYSYTQNFYVESFHGLESIP